jgi:hypothetical protein
MDLINKHYGIRRGLPVSIRSVDPSGKNEEDLYINTQHRTVQIIQDSPASKLRFKGEPPWNSF